jgi:hypothetical protein
MLKGSSTIYNLYELEKKEHGDSLYAKKLLINWLMEEIDESHNQGAALKLATIFASGFDSQGGTKSITFEDFDFNLEIDVPRSDENCIRMLEIASELGQGASELAMIYYVYNDDSDLHTSELRNCKDYLETIFNEGSGVVKEWLSSELSKNESASNLSIR